MARLIKRYGSRKLYDTENSCYISLEDIAAWVREGIDVQVIDNAGGHDVTSQTLTQVISEEGRKGASLLPHDVLHDLIRAGGTAVTKGVRQLQNGVDQFVKKSMDKLVPVRRVREEMASLKERLEALEKSIAQVEAHKSMAMNNSETAVVEAPEKKAPVKRAARTRRTTTAAKSTDKPAERSKAATSGADKTKTAARKTTKKTSTAKTTAAKGDK